jgi:crotonobetainyl-CoA:carnitine CoA-transferase CaiB-like acyl-CoA transferase
MLERHPRLVYVSIWAFGYQGPMRLAPGFDPLLQAFGGMMSLTGRPEDPPTLCGASINDKATGMFSVIGALAALRHRDRTGQGCLVDTSLLETAVHWVEGPLNGFIATGNVPMRHGTGGNAIVPYQVFDTADAPICLAAGNDRLWARTAKVLGHPEWGTEERFATGPQRVRHKAELIPLIAAVLKTRTRAHWLAALGAVGVPAGPVNNIDELVATEQFAAVGIMQELPGGGPQVVGLPISFNRARPLSGRDSPKLGEHNEEVLGPLRG